MQSENLLRTECGGYESDEGTQRASQQYFPPHQYNVSHWGTTRSGFTLYIIAGTVLERDFIPRPGDTISLYFYPFIVSLTNTFLPLVITKNYRKWIEILPVKLLKQQQVTKKIIFTRNYLIFSVSWISYNQSFYIRIFLVSAAQSGN